MRILVLTNLYPSPELTSGDIVMTERRVHAYLERGHEVSVLSSIDSLPGGPESHPILKVTTHILGKSWLAGILQRSSRYLPSKLTNARLVRRFLDQFVPDVVDVSNIGGLSIFSYLPVLERGIPSVVSLVDETYVGACGFGSPFSRLLLRGFGKVSEEALRSINGLPCSHHMRKVFIGHGFNASRLAVVPYGVEEHPPGHYAPLAPSTPSEPLKALYIGRMVPEKGVDVFLRSVCQLKKQASGLSVQATVVGSTPASGGLDVDALIRELGLEGSVRHYPAVLPSRIPEIITEHHVLVVPSNWPEPFGLVTLEAMALGRPVIVSRVGALTELVRDGEQGLSVPAGDPPALAEAMRRMGEHPEQMAAMGEAGLARVRGEFSFQRYIDNMLGAMQAAVDGCFEEFARSRAD